MAAMAEFPDKYFDLAVVDPPYGIGVGKMNMGIGTGKRCSKAKNRKWTAKAWDSEAPPPEYFIELFRVSKNQIIWGGNYFSLPPTQGFVIWDKQIAESLSFSQFEYAWTSYQRAAKGFDYSVYLNESEKFHPTQKPVALYKWLLTNYAKPGDKILDTHLGSGSSRIAAWDMGFDFWGYELDADYFAAMEVRFKAHISKPVLFAPEEMYQVNQTKLFAV